MIITSELINLHENINRTQLMSKIKEKHLFIGKNFELLRKIITVRQVE